MHHSTREKRLSASAKPRKAALVQNRSWDRWAVWFPPAGFHGVGFHGCARRHPGVTMEAPMSDSSQPPGRVIEGNCGICPSGCSVKITLQGDRITRVVPDPRRPNGMCCRRVSRAAEILYSPDRLTFPLAREGKRGENRFRRVSWDEALDITATRLREIKSRFGPEALCLYTGRGTFERSLWEMLAPAGVRETCAWSLLFPFGSPNTTGAGSNCYVSQAVIAPATTYGLWWADTTRTWKGRTSSWSGERTPQTPRRPK